MNKTPLSKLIAKDKAALQAAVGDALRTFTENTGIFVDCLSFSCSVARGADSYPVAFQYHNVTAELSLGE